MERLMLKPTEAAEALGICRSKLYQLVRANAIPHRKIGSSIRIPTSSLRAYAEVNEDALPARKRC
jgi:excisionase family DNA binding protein